MPKIFTESRRLFFREIIPSDIEVIYQLHTDPEVIRFLGKKPLKSFNEADDLIKNIQLQYSQNGIGRWAMVEKRFNNVIGWSGIKFINQEVNTRKNYYDIGYRILKSYWGKGYGTEAAEAAVHYGFNVMKLNKIYAITETDNVPSKKVLLKTGFQLMETFDLYKIPHWWFEKENKSHLVQNSAK